MKLPLEVVVRGKKLPPRMQEAIQEHADRLDHFYDRLMRGPIGVDDGLELIRCSALGSVSSAESFENGSKLKRVVELILRELESLPSSA